MPSRFGFVGLIVCLLLAGHASVAPLSYAYASAATIERGAVGSRHPVAALCLYVVHAGRLQKRVIPATELTRQPVISISGYVNGIVLLSKAALTVSVDGKSVPPIAVDTRGNFKLQYFGELGPQEFWSIFLGAEDTPAMEAQIQGRYGLFPKVQGDALSDGQEFQIILGQNGTKDRLTIRQDACIRLDACTLPAHETTTPQFYYQGNRIDRYT